MIDITILIFATSSLNHQFSYYNYLTKFAFFESYYSRQHFMILKAMFFLCLQFLMRVALLFVICNWKLISLIVLPFSKIRLFVSWLASYLIFFLKIISFFILRAVFLQSGLLSQSIFDLNSLRENYINFQLLPNVFPLIIKVAVFFIIFTVDYSTTLIAIWSFL